MLVDISRIASGQFIAQLMLLISLPFIARYYSPEDFGVFAVFSAIAWVLVVIASVKAELLIITMESKSEATSLTIEILLLILLFSVFISVVIEIFFLDFFLNFVNSDIKHLSWFLGLTIFFIGGAQTLRYYATYLGVFSGHGIAAILNSIGIIFIALGYAFFAKEDEIVLGLILGQMIGQMLSFLVFIFYTDIVKLMNFQNLSNPFTIIFSQLRKIPTLLTTQVAFVFSLSIPTFIVTIVGGSSSAGALAMANRLVSMPTSAFGHAIGQVVRHQFGEVYNTDKKNITFPRKIIKFSFYLSILGYGSIILLADWLVPLLLGEQWLSAIPFVQIIAFMELFNFVFYSIEDVSIIRDNLYYRMWSQLFQVLFLVVIYIAVITTDVLINIEFVLGLICLARILFVVYDLNKTWKGEYIGLR